MQNAEWKKNRVRGMNVRGIKTGEMILSIPLTNIPLT
jgi:hypothetical protein